MIRIAICDDNKAFINYMTKVVKREFATHTTVKFEIESYTSSELFFYHHSIKPFDIVFLDYFFVEKLHNVVNQLFNEMKQNTTIVLENKEIGRVALMIKDIYYIQSCKHYILYYSEGRDPIKIRGNLSEAEEYFSSFDFVKIHKSYIVNLRHIFNIDKKMDEIIFKQGFRLNMSKNYKKQVDEKLTEYLRRTK